MTELKWKDAIEKVLNEEKKQPGRAVSLQTSLRKVISFLS